MRRYHPCLFLLFCAAGVHAESWTFLGTFGGKDVLADGRHDLRLTAIDPTSGHILAPPITLTAVPVQNATIAVTFDAPDVTPWTSPGATGPFAIRMEALVDANQVILLGNSTAFDANEHRQGFCWDAPTDETGAPRAHITSGCLFAMSAHTKSGPSGGAYELRKQVIAGGGQAALGGGYALVGTVGQSAVTQVSGGSYQLTGGFHGPVVAAPPLPDALFGNGFEN